VEDRQRDIAALLDRQVDGVLYATMFHREVSLPANIQEVPAVLIDALDRAGIIPSVVPNEEEGARTAMTALLEAGHRRIGFINNSEDIPATHGRLIGYARALADAGIDVDPALVTQGAADVPGGCVAASRLLDAADRPTALFCFNDAMAMGAYRAASERGLRIPEDLSVVGFDNSELIAANLLPGLTTVALPHYEMGAWAVDTLVALLQGREEARGLADLPVLMRCPLVPRGSVAPPNAL
jgi:LacI family transcriptional regulator